MPAAGSNAGIGSLAVGNTASCSTVMVQQDRFEFHFSALPAHRWSIALLCRCHTRAISSTIHMSTEASKREAGNDNLVITNTTRFNSIKLPISEASLDIFSSALHLINPQTKDLSDCSLAGWLNRLETLRALFIMKKRNQTEKKHKNTCDRNWKVQKSKSGLSSSINYASSEDKSVLQRDECLPAPAT